MMGQADRAERIAGLISDPWERADALLGVVKVLARNGEHGRSRDVAGRMADLVETMSDDDRGRASVLVEAVRARAYAGDPDVAEDMARSLPIGYDRTRALVGLMETAASAGDLARVTRLAGQVADRDQRPAVLRSLVTAAFRAGDEKRVADLVTQVATLVSEASPYSGRVDHNEVRFLISALARAGEPNRAAAIARSMEGFHRDAALAELVRVAADAGNAARAEKLLNLITDAQKRVQALAHLANAVAMNGDRDRVTTLVDQTLAEFAAIESPTMVPPLPELATALARVGDRNRAVEIAQTITIPRFRAEALVALAREADDRPTARRYVALALRTPDWTHTVDELVNIRSDAVATLAEEYLRTIGTSTR
jgi:hypothetical protein